MVERSGCVARGCVRLIAVVLLLPVVLGLSWWLLSNISRVLTHESVEAVVVDLIPSVDSDGDTLYRPVYEYQVDGATYRYESRASLGGMVVPNIGDRKTLLYDPDQPGDARVQNYLLLLILPLILLAVPVLILAAMLWTTLQRSRRPEVASPGGGTTPVPPWASPNEPPVPLDEPAVTGEVIEATFMGTEPSQMDARGNMRYRVKARAEIDGVMHRFRGPWQDEDPTLLFMELGNKVQVRIEPNDPSSYEVLMPGRD
ncbi:MAG: DUF3592 domain-containing protein [Acidimicrobiia bacterium]|nr:DUF3592 domain-containing protein [Acidimicrobiia bacterium]